MDFAAHMAKTNGSTDSTVGVQPDLKPPVKTELPEKLSNEQEIFIETAAEGKNILVDACIGSGKTTAIQALCNALPQSKVVLYLTYNKLLKADAKTKIKAYHVNVTNYHGFAYTYLRNAGITCGVSDLIQTFNREKPPIPEFSALILDEYQDIDQEISEMLEYIKHKNPGLQIIAVGDYEQKIYDKTSLDVRDFIDSFLEEYTRLEFTQCFRLSDELASQLGRIWEKNIKGVNPDCEIEIMGVRDALRFLSAQEPRDVLCLGARRGVMADVLNQLEDYFPEKYNKHTVYASIQERDGMVAAPEHAAIFSTFDASKGMERKICVVFDFTETQWAIRAAMPGTRYEILRNIFCVAASRGKDKIIFVKTDDILSEQTLRTPTDNAKIAEQEYIATMFDFKFKEDVEAAFATLDCKQLQPAGGKPIEIDRADALIDLSPVIGNYQEAVFFDKYDAHTMILDQIAENSSKSYLYKKSDEKSSLDQKLLILTAIQTNQDRYKNQVSLPLATEDQKQQLMDRLATELKPDEETQVGCGFRLQYARGPEDYIQISGKADVVKGPQGDETIWELKFVSELTSENFLQCACYMVALRKKSGILWNTRTNEKWLIKIPNPGGFLDAVLCAITKGAYKTRYRKTDSNKKPKQGSTTNKKTAGTKPASQYQPAIQPERPVKNKPKINKRK